MQDGREKFLEITDGSSINKDRRKSLKSMDSQVHTHDEHNCDNELERLKQENARLMKLLGEKPNP